MPNDPRIQNPLDATRWRQVKDKMRALSTGANLREFSAQKCFFAQWNEKSVDKSIHACGVRGGERVKARGKGALDSLEVEGGSRDLKLLENEIRKGLNT
jgi:hypothetical protein